MAANPESPSFSAMMKTQPLCPEGEEPARAARLAVQRAAAELRRGEAIVIAMAGREALIAIAAELAGRPDLVRLRAEGAGLLLALTSERAAALGLADGGASGTIAVPLGQRVEPAEIVAIADPSRPVRATATGWVAGPPLPASATVAAAVRMMRIARLLPAALVVPVTAEAVLAAERDLIVVDVDDLARYDEASASALAIVGEARVPLAGAETARLIAFRPQDGGNEHLAVVIGTPEPGQPVLARIHSE